MDVSQEKLVPPTTRLEFLGITFDSTTMTMEISEQKMQDIMTELRTWLYKGSTTRKEVESLIGKLQFLAKCIKAGRIFLSRLIQWIRGMDRRHRYPVPLEARKDIAWWSRCAHEFNGVSIIWLIQEPNIDAIIATDVCLSGYGGTNQGEYFRGRFPSHLKGANIAYLEILAVMVALKIWGNKLKGQYFWIHVDNEAVASVLNSGASRDINLQNTLLLQQNTSLSSRPNTSWGSQIKCQTGSQDGGIQTQERPLGNLHETVVLSKSGSAANTCPLKINGNSHYSFTGTGTIGLGRSSNKRTFSQGVY